MPHPPKMPAPSLMNDDPNDSEILYDMPTTTSLSARESTSYYGDISYNEWCQKGRLSLIRFRRKQRQRRSTIGAILSTGVGVHEESSKAGHQDSSHSLIESAKKRSSSGIGSPSPLKKEKLMIGAKDDADLLSITGGGTKGVLTSPSLHSSKDYENGSHVPELRMDIEDDNGDQGFMVMDEDEHPTMAFPSSPKIPTSIPEPSSVLPRIAPSPFFSLWTRWRATKKPTECFGRRETPDPNAGVLAFTVQESPAQCIALIEGISDAAPQNPIVDQNYFASPQFHYLSDLLHHGQLDLFPRHGYATELPLTSPAFPGPWMARVLSSNSLDLVQHPFLPTRQSEWNGSRIRLVHHDYEHRLSEDEAVLGTESVSIVRIDPKARRTALQNPQHVDPFVGAMAVVLFDGFASTAESAALQGPLSECILQELHQSLAAKLGTASPVLHHAIQSVNAFTAESGSNRSTSDVVSGCGGVALPICVSCGGTSKGNRDDYYLLLYTCDAVNSLVAIDIVFHEAPFCLDDENCIESDNSLCHVDEQKGLTLKQLDHHASIWSAVNVLTFWKQRYHSPTSTGVSPEDMSADGPLMPSEESCVHPLPDNVGNETMAEVFSAQDDEDSRTTEMVSNKLVLPESPSTFASADSPMIDKRQATFNTAVEARPQEEAPTILASHAKVSTVSTGIVPHGNCFDIPLDSMLPKQCHRSFHHVTPTPHRLVETVRSPESFTNQSVSTVIQSKYLFPETKMIESIPISTTAASGELSLEEQLLVPHVTPEWSQDVAPELSYSDVMDDAAVSWPSWHSIFYGIHDEQEFPEMSQNELMGWILNTATLLEDDPVVCLHDALFGWALDDFNHDGDSFFPWFFYNWFIPIVVWLLTCLFFLWMDASMADVVFSSSQPPLGTDPSRLLLAPLQFEFTGDGYVGMIRID